MRRVVKDIVKMWEDFDNMFNWTTTVWTQEEQRNWKTYKLEDGSIKLVIDLPGYGREDVEIEVEDNIITIGGELEDREFSKSFRVPKDTDVDNIDAEMKNGVLTVVVPIMEQKSKSKKIRIG